MFSSVVNFTTEQFLKRVGKLSVLTDLENQSESGQLSCSLQFPKHHKRCRPSAASKKPISNSSVDVLTHDNIQKTICRAFDDAYHLLSELDVHVALKKAKKTKMLQVSSFVRAQFDRKFKKLSYDDIESYLTDDDDDDRVTNSNPMLIFQRHQYMMVRLMMMKQMMYLHLQLVVNPSFME